MIEEGTFANVIRLRVDVIMNDKTISTREKLIRIDEIEKLSKDVKLWSEVKEIYNELGEI
jgi:hypothetical protein